MKFGIDRILTEPALRAPLQGRRVALLAHPASVTRILVHSLDALAACGDMKLIAAFGPQHGLRGDKQDNMMESPTYNDPLYGIPVFSLYGEVRRPTDAMMATFDVMLVDLQDLGCRIYTFVTTLRYVLEAASQHRKAVWMLDRPNPVGRPIEGCGCAPDGRVSSAPDRCRCATDLRSASWACGLSATLRLDVECRRRRDGGVAARKPRQDMAGRSGSRTWINPSPNAPNLWMARCYAGDGDGRGYDVVRGPWHDTSARIVGAPDIDAELVVRKCAGSLRTG